MHMHLNLSRLEIPGLVSRAARLEFIFARATYEYKLQYDIQVVLRKIVQVDYERLIRRTCGP
jgi:hypothetical protein